MSGLLPRLAIVGAGRLGTVLGVALDQAGYPVVAVASRSLRAAPQLAARVQGCEAVRSPGEAADGADLVLVTVPDDAIAEVADRIPWRTGQIAVHCSGALPAAVLSTPKGTLAAGFHPLQTFADFEAGLANLPGSWVGIEADDLAWPALEEMATRLGARALRIRDEDRSLYHAGAVIVSNLSVGLVALAAELWRRLGIDRAEAVSALQPLLAGTSRNLGTLGVPNALTGPVVRGDIGTVKRHLDALASTPEVGDVYRLLSTVLIGLALERATITESQAEALRRVLDAPAT